MFNIKVCLFVARVVESLLHKMSIVGMNSMKYQLKRWHYRWFVFKDVVGFLQPVDFYTRNVPAEAACMTQSLGFGQVSFPALNISVEISKLSDRLVEDSCKMAECVLART